MNKPLTRADLDTMPWRNSGMRSQDLSDVFPREFLEEL